MHLVGFIMRIYHDARSSECQIHAAIGIRTHNLTRRAAADLCLRPRNHWDRKKHE